MLIIHVKIYFMIRRYLFSCYVVLEDGVWVLKESKRVDINGKNSLLADMKRKGYVYNRVEKAYFMKHEISPYSYAVTIKGFKI